MQSCKHWRCKSCMEEDGMYHVIFHIVMITIYVNTTASIIKPNLARESFHLSISQHVKAICNPYQSNLWSYIFCNLIRGSQYSRHISHCSTVPTCALGILTFLVLFPDQSLCRLPCLTCTQNFVGMTQ